MLCQYGDIIYQGQFEKDKPISQYPSNNIDLQKYFSYFDFGNGEYFLGEMEKETANGYGIMVYDNGDLCIGNFKEGKRNGIGLYLLYNGEWETINFEGDNYNIVSSSINYRNIDANRKANIKSSLSEAFGYFAQAANQTVQIASEVQSIKKEKSLFPIQAQMSIYPKIQIYPMIIFPKKRNPLQSLILYPQIKTKILTAGHMRIMMEC